ncbi:phosphatidate cytidylyltransferase 2 [Dunaliella salina]|uniref:Phosphatidate cytidylyltransferase n=1 Tax=Dunaliella salina TaxID=3046 RepID=A0ABQ7GT50_DUNSA|nr:phosphatidate cytidylyltransferase 2 [Dunaliella salina]|eukprot:KAF5837757.1 phosphatidate cytidylyltransferase 2 [Dunaliella salina]
MIRGLVHILHFFPSISPCAGFFFGRTPLIKLSPKKTWEGFVGGLLGTVIVAYVLSQLLAGHKWMICPRRDLSLGPLDCEVPEEFLPHRYTWDDVDELIPEPVVEVMHMQQQQLPSRWADRLKGISIEAMPVQLHAMVLALFASVIAPFGGFCASGFKRAFGMKDFGDTIPGHGGVTDRFDCQVIMAMFSYVYYWTYISSAELSVGDVLDTALKLRDAQQVELFCKLGNLLVGESLLPGTAMDVLAPYMRQTIGNNSCLH